MNACCRPGRFFQWCVVLLGVIAWVGWGVLAGAPATAPATQPTTAPAMQLADLGPDVIVMKELMAMYEPVPFDHKSHAKMSQMWDGCTTCHHRPPSATTRPASTLKSGPMTQAASAGVPACKSCHAVAEKDGDIQMPNLKGAYHRQCLNCHREWMHGNACVICHKPKGAAGATEAAAPTRSDIVGRMHPPIAEPEAKLYQMRYTPADGGNVLFRHKEHIKNFGLRCVDCHRHDNCSHCHDPKADTAAVKPVRPGKTWADSHGPCMSCHKQDRCGHCHYKTGQASPAVFEHRMTGQVLDKDHISLACVKCHSALKLKFTPTCGGSECHKPTKTIAFPADRPGPATTRPATQAAAQPTTQQAVTQPASTRPVIQRIRR